MLSKERSFNRLCTLIKVADDSEETAAEVNEVLNELYPRYSELKIFRAVASRFSHHPDAQAKNNHVRHRALKRQLNSEVIVSRDL